MSNDRRVIGKTSKVNALEERELEAGARELGISVSELLRKGGLALLRQRRARATTNAIAAERHAVKKPSPQD